MHTVLVPLDGSKLSEQAIPAALAIARDAGAAIELLLVHALGPIATFASMGRVEQPRTVEEEYLDGVASRVAAESGLRVTCEVAPGAVVDTICAKARERGADVIVMTSHGRTGFNRVWLGSVADGVVRRSNVPVLLVRAGAVVAPPRLPIRSVLVPLDGSARAEQALDAVHTLGSEEHRITLLRVVRPVPVVVTAPDVPYTLANTAMMDDAATLAAESIAQEHVDRMATRIRATTPGATVDTRIMVDDRVASAILDTAKRLNVDAIAMTTHAGALPRLLLGSTADKVLRGASVPLLFTRPRTHHLEEREAAERKRVAATV